MSDDYNEHEPCQEAIANLRRQLAEAQACAEKAESAARLATQAAQEQRERAEKAERERDSWKDALRVEQNEYDKMKRERDEAQAAWADLLHGADYNGCSSKNECWDSCCEVAAATIHQSLREGRKFGQPILDRLASLEAENARLREVVEKLPKTADGVPITPDMKLYCENGHECEWWTYEPAEAGCIEAGCIEAGCFDEGDQITGANGPGIYELSECYSTRAAAEAAKGTKP